jgi:hypothetical protein
MVEVVVVDCTPELLPAQPKRKTNAKYVRSSLFPMGLGSEA